MKAWINRHPLSSFFIVTYAVSWSVAVPLALQAQGVLPTHLPGVLHYATAFGPAGAALVITRLLARPQPHHRQRSGARSLAWMAVGFGSPLLLHVVALVAARFVGQPAPTWRSLGHINFLPDLGVMAWALWFFTSGIGEEFGWRGFALPELQQTRSAMRSTLLLAIGWAGWHLPAFFYVPTYTAIGLRVLPGFFLGVLAGAIVLTWLYNSSSGSVLTVVLWHASFNFVTASPSAGGFVAAVTSTLVMVWAIAVVWRCDWTTLAARSAGVRSVRATREEQMRPLPGDERIPNAIDSLTHAVTIRRAPRDVWPWLVQMGAGTRAGWYSYDWLDNARQSSATRIVPDLQHPTVGTIFPALPGATDGFTLLVIEPQSQLILGWVTSRGVTEVTWTFFLEETSPGVTRLLVRARGGPGYRFHGLPLLPTRVFVRFVHFIMQRKQLLGIADRVETPDDLSPFTDPDPADRSAFNHLFYRNRRPTWIGHWVSQFFCWWARIGLPPRSWFALEVRDRASGRTRSDAVVVPTVAGERYIVSMFGTISDWVHNVDAAHGEAVIAHGRSEHVRLVLVAPDGRAPILREYVQVASSGRKHFPLPVGAPLVDFAAIASQYPVYRIEAPLR